MRIRVRRSTQFLQEDDIRLISKASEAFAHPLRLKMFQYIMEKNAHLEPVCNKDLVDKFQYAQSTISQHMGLLIRSGLVQLDRDGKYSYYFVHTGNYNTYIQAMTKFIQLKANVLR